MRNTRKGLFKVGEEGFLMLALLNSWENNFYNLKPNTKALPTPESCNVCALQHLPWSTQGRCHQETSEQSNGCPPKWEVTPVKRWDC